MNFSPKFFNDHRIIGQFIKNISNLLSPNEDRIERICEDEDIPSASLYINIWPKVSVDRVIRDESIGEFESGTSFRFNTHVSD